MMNKATEGEVVPVLVLCPPVNANQNAVADLLCDANFASGQVRDLLWHLYEHPKLEGEDGLFAVILACLEYLEDQENAIKRIKPLIGFRNDSEPLAGRPG